VNAEPILTLPRSANLRQAYDLAIAGAVGALCGLYLYVELVHADSVWLRDALAGAMIGGAIGFFLNASGPSKDGAWLKLARDSTWGVLAGAIGGAVALVVGEAVLGVLQGGLVGRAASWAILGMGLGISQGVASRSVQRLVYGLIGGSIGGFLGGFLFEAIRKALGNRYDLGQGVGIVLLGAGLGLSLALVEQALRRAWVQVLNGRQEGRAYLLASKVSTIGLDERAEVGLFGDPTVARKHAEVVVDGRDYRLTSLAPSGRTKVNGEVVTGPRPLNDGDRIEIGQTRLLFRRR
jgi:hypothetical protein